jgi:hypothetical protein
VGLSPEPLGKERERSAILASGIIVTMFHLRAKGKETTTTTTFGGGNSVRV